MHVLLKRVCQSAIFWRPAIGLALVGTLLTISTARAADTPTSTRPNIIYIMADDLGYGDLGCYGQQRIQTPNLDRMAAEGMRFTDFYAGNTVCAPSRCVLMTGLHMGHCYIRGNGKIDLRPEDVTVAEILKQGGYKTGLAGKWGLGHEGGTGVPTRQGFDMFFGYLDQHHAHNYYPSFLIRGEQRVQLDNVVPGEGEYGQGVASEKKTYSHDLIAQAAMDFVDEHHAEPFFLYLALTLPHANNEARNKGMEIPDYGIYRDKDWPDAQKGLAAMITRVDTEVGRILTRLKEHGIDDRTVVFFTSDNGPHREGGNDPDYFDSNGPLRGIKRALYEGGIRVPMIVRWPGKIQAGSVSHHVGYFGDFLPTAAELAGVTAPEGLDGHSIVPTLLGDKSERTQAEHDFLYWEFYEQGSRQAVRMGRWKAVCEPMGSQNVELFDLETDLGEQHDVAAEHPDLVKQALQHFRKAHTPSPLWKPIGRRRRAVKGT